MILEFTVGNFMSFKEPKTLSLEASKITEFKDSVFEKSSYKLLKSAVVYGANSSGKSNLIFALSMMDLIIRTSAEKNSISKTNILPFLLNERTQNEPTLFEVILLIEHKRYRYGFTLDISEVYQEWLFELNEEKDEEIELFTRRMDKIHVCPIFKEEADESLVKKTRVNALFLSVLDQFNGEVAGKIMKWFDSLKVISGLEHEDYRDITAGLLDDEESRSKLTSFYKTIDLGFDDLRFEKQPFQQDILPIDMPIELRNKLISNFEGEILAKIKTLHNVYDDDGQKVGIMDFNLLVHESAGTNKVIDLSGPLFDTLLNGGVLVIDELDAKLHPLLTNAIVSLFHSPVYNKRNAQLIFATHDTNLLKYGKFRRDQIYFVEKDKYGASDLYSLVEYIEPNGNGKMVRKDRSFENDYIQGRYGAIPFIGKFEEFISNAS